MTVALPPGFPNVAEIEALIAAARRRQRRRQRLTGLVIALVLVVGLVGYVAARDIGAGRGSSGGPARGPLGRSAPGIRLVWPGALALGAHGVLYIADRGRHQILARLPNGTFRVVAGTGKAGFSGDGAPALRAEINAPAGMAIGRDGTLYFADAAEGGRADRGRD